MANYDCGSCADLRETAPQLIVNGFDDTMCTSLANDTGLVSTSGHNDCTDLNDMNDCLVGNMATEVDAYDVCDWKSYMKKFVPNVWTVLKGIICAICGIWTNIHNLWTKINEILDTISKFQCYINSMLTPTDVTATLDQSAFVAGTDVEFDRQDDLAIPPSVVVNGSTYTISGSIRVHLTNSRWNNLGLTNSGSTESGHVINTPSGNYTLCIVKIPIAQFPSIKALHTCVGQFINAADGQLWVQVRNPGETYSGQWGYDDSARITVPAGEMHIRVSLASLTTWGIEHGASDNYADVTFRATGLAVTNPIGTDCD